MSYSETDFDGKKLAGITMRAEALIAEMRGLHGQDVKAKLAALRKLAEHTTKAVAEAEENATRTLLALVEPAVALHAAIIAANAAAEKLREIDKTIKAFKLADKPAVYDANEMVSSLQRLQATAFNLTQFVKTHKPDIVSAVGSVAT